MSKSVQSETLREKSLGKKNPQSPNNLWEIFIHLES